MSIFLCEVSSVLALHVLFEYTAVILIIPNDEFFFIGCQVAMVWACVVKRR